MTKEINKSLILELMNSKYDLEEANIKDYQRIVELKRERLKRIGMIDNIENDIRRKFDRERIKNRANIRSM